MNTQQYPQQSFKQRPSPQSIKRGINAYAVHQRANRPNKRVGNVAHLHNIPSGVDEKINDEFWQSDI